MSLPKTNGQSVTKRVDQFTDLELALLYREKINEFDIAKANLSALSAEIDRRNGLKPGLKPPSEVKKNPLKKAK